MGASGDQLSTVARRPRREPPIPTFPQRGKEMSGTARGVLTEPYGLWPDTVQYGSVNDVKLPPLLGEGWGGGQRRPGKHSGPTPAP